MDLLFRGVPLTYAIRLARPACPIDEPVIHELSSTVDRLVEAANRKVRDDEMNIFVHKRIMPFISGREIHNKTLVFKLQVDTYRQHRMLIQTHLERLSIVLLLTSLWNQHHLPTLADSYASSLYDSHLIRKLVLTRSWLNR